MAEQRLLTRTVRLYGRFASLGEPLDDYFGKTAAYGADLLLALAFV